jgi:hypothetical protein
MLPACAMLHPVAGQSVQGADSWRVHARAVDVANGAEVALFSGLNAHADAVPEELPAGARVVVSGGWLEADARAAEAEGGDDALDAMRPTWTSGPRTRVQEFFERAAASAERAVGHPGARVLVRPRAGDVVSDIPSTLALLRALPRVGLALEPALLLPPDRLGAAPDLLARYLDAFGDHPALELVVLSGVLEGAGRRGRETELSCSDLDPKLLAPFARLGKPVVFIKDPAIHPYLQREQLLYELGVV